MAVWEFMARERLEETHLQRLRGRRGTALRSGVLTLLLLGALSCMPHPRTYFLRFFSPSSMRDPDLPLLLDFKSQRTPAFSSTQHSHHLLSRESSSSPGTSTTTWVSAVTQSLVRAF
ncbi:hypothetical protein BV25DRAFT_1578227 [Artomyces pyxidatus]|uniref:Uncharacterized protein n=1 Tax=Artomyces pyxidatus TaxID=48021 RepID=A0ACB8SJK7_9AGAM|nr:hypothetical protein BV25DRAFT_1578227 [Artomyces pyxidatus]